MNIMIASRGTPHATVWAVLTKWRRRRRLRSALFSGSPVAIATTPELFSERKVLRARLRAIDGELAMRAIAQG
jgi:hypothetical protein